MSVCDDGSLYMCRVMRWRRCCLRTRTTTRHYCVPVDSAVLRRVPRNHHLRPGSPRRRLALTRTLKATSSPRYDDDDDDDDDDDAGIEFCRVKHHPVSNHFTN